MKDETIISKDTVESFETITGKIPYTLLNDYMFHYLFQEDKESLKMFCCALLGIDADKITNIVVENPIIPGKSFDEKGVILDLLITFDSGERVNIELQVVNEGDWTNRSLIYLCRSFDKLAKGGEYRVLKSATHIGIIDFSLQEYGLSPEFYARYKLMNVKNHEIYNSNFNLNVLSLNHIDLATDEDCSRELNYWAAMFKAKTWEDIKLIAEKSEVFKTIAKDLYNSNSDWLVQEECRRREERLAREKYINEHTEELERTNAELIQTNSELTQTNSELTLKILELEKRIQELKENE